MDGETIRVMTEGDEAEMIRIILEQVRLKKMTANNVKSVASKVVEYLNGNAVLEK